MLSSERQINSPKALIQPELSHQRKIYTWNIFEEIGEPENRQEILDWYHLKENLYKLGGTRKRVKELEEQLLQWFCRRFSGIIEEQKNQKSETIL